jgi:hypothetical protein
MRRSVTSSVSVSQLSNAHRTAAPLHRFTPHTAPRCPIPVLRRERRTPLTPAERVQLGVALSAAEKLQAIPGPWGTWIGELLKKYILPEGTLSDAIPWDTKRGKPFQAVASMVLLCHDLTRTSPPTSTEMHKWLERSDGVGPQI